MNGRTPPARGSNRAADGNETRPRPREEGNLLFEETEPAGIPFRTRDSGARHRHGGFRQVGNVVPLARRAEIAPRQKWRR